MNDSTSPDSPYLREIIAERSKRADEQRAMGLDPFPPRTGRTHTLEEACAFFVASEEAGEPEPTEPVTIAGRAHAIRNMGRIAFIDLEDDSGALQVLASRRALGDAWDRIDSFDLGDFIESSGKMIRSRRGEVSLQAADRATAGQGATAAAREIPRAARPGAALPPSIRRPDG